MGISGRFKVGDAIIIAAVLVAAAIAALIPFIPRETGRTVEVRTADGRAAVVPVPFFLFHSFSSFRCHNNSQYSITASFGNLNPNLTIHRKFTAPPRVLSCKSRAGVIRFEKGKTILNFPMFFAERRCVFE